MSSAADYLNPAQFDALARVASGELTHGAEDHTTSCLMRTLLRRGFLSRLIHAPVGATWSLTDAGVGKLRRRREWDAAAAERWPEGVRDGRAIPVPG